MWPAARLPSETSSILLPEAHLLPRARGELPRPPGLGAHRRPPGLGPEDLLLPLVPAREEPLRPQALVLPGELPQRRALVPGQELARGQVLLLEALQPYPKLRGRALPEKP